MPAYLVTGATGSQGGAVARHLLAQNQTVHALVRDPTAPSALALHAAGATLFKGTFEDLPSLKAAAQGTRGIFLNPFPDYKNPTVTTGPQGVEKNNQVVQTENVLEAARVAGTVVSVVVSTLYGTPRHKEWVAKEPGYPLGVVYGPKFELEQVVRDAVVSSTAGGDGAVTTTAVAQSGEDNAAGAGNNADRFLRHITILRPAWLHQNYLPPGAGAHFPELLQQQQQQQPPHNHNRDDGVAGRAQQRRELVVTVDPKLSMPHIDADDIGSFAAAALISPEEWAGREIEMGFEDLTVGEAAGLMTEIGAGGSGGAGGGGRGGGEVEGEGGKAKVEVVYKPEGKAERMVDLFRVRLRDHPIEGEDLERFGVPVTTLKGYFEREKKTLVEVLEGKLEKEADAQTFRVPAGSS